MGVLDMWKILRRVNSLDQEFEFFACTKDVVTDNESCIRRIFPEQLIPTDSQMRKSFEHKLEIERFFCSALLFSIHFAIISFSFSGAFVLLILPILTPW